MSNINLIMAAARFAAVAHAGQKRKYSDLPYIIHPARVAGRTAVLDGATEDMVISAYLHDVLEDTNTIPSDIGTLFGQRVLDLVTCLTKPSLHSKEVRKVRVQMDLEHYSRMPATAKCIKMLDRIDNLTDMLGEDMQDVQWAVKYAGESAQLLAAIGDADYALGDEIQVLIDYIRIRR